MMELKPARNKVTGPQGKHSCLLIPMFCTQSFHTIQLELNVRGRYWTGTDPAKYHNQNSKMTNQ